MAFDPTAPRQVVKARAVRADDYVRIQAGEDERCWARVKVIDLSWPDALMELDGGVAISIGKDAEVEVSRRVEWVEVEGRYRVVDTTPYLEREDEYSDLSLEAAAGRAEDLTGHPADDIIACAEEADGRWEWVDEETGREVSLIPEVEPEPNRKVPPPEAGDMSTSDGLGA